MSFARVRALAVVGVLIVAAAIFVIVAVVKDHQGGPAAEGGKCPEGSVLADAKLPRQQDVKVTIFNATSRSGAGSDVANDLLSRQFKEAKVVTAAPNPPVNKPGDEVAVIRYGPATVGAAWLVRAYFLNRATAEFDKARQDDKVEIILGGKFKQLPTTTEVNQAIAALGNPELPPGTCAKDDG
ncbi:LytR C-terminal domain-containing protein [Dactylosporangium matsuzakiense]|uniref:LytR C-terminal domain-containing protein n=1 Tax=Dactylosporangium matsuzakiense TaxID=53360 RepID=UPI0021C30983|nr:LytR C-terminal domain-containing protein [Dactylosporangium matsuzakiense]UWZ46486.1 LytR C-terminal domain-containing protein [Dactylosporangium matsuzakiense]